MRRQPAEPAIRNRLRVLRTARGLSQAALGRRAGLTRQAVSAIEGGRYVPNTAVALRLARALGCRVEALFRLHEPSVEREVHLAEPAASGEGGRARAVVARVGDRLVAHPLRGGRALREGFASADALLSDPGPRPAARLLVSPERLERTALVLGCDPSLSLVVSHMGRRSRDAPLAWLPATSRQALDGVDGGVAHLAGCHLLDPDGEEYNVAHARAVLGGQGGYVITFASWEQGLVVARGNPKGLASVADLARPDVRLVNRERGAGARQLLDDLLRREGLPAARVPGYEREAESHLAVARTVAAGAADAGVALRAAAEAHGLDFLPFSHVRFDLVVPRRSVDHPGVAVLLDLLRGRALREEVGALPGYEVEEMGTVVAEIDAAA